jgi:hypothetical protein
VFAARLEANDNVKYLRTLEGWFAKLNAGGEGGDFERLPELFRPILHILLLVWKNSKFYNTPARLVVVIREIVNALIAQVSSPAAAEGRCSTGGGGSSCVREGGSVSAEAASVLLSYGAVPCVRRAVPPTFCTRLCLAPLRCPHQCHDPLTSSVTLLIPRPPPSLPLPPRRPCASSPARRSLT